MRISDWSSDVCSSDLAPQHEVNLLLLRPHPEEAAPHTATGGCLEGCATRWHSVATSCSRRDKRGSAASGDRKSVVEGKSVSVRVDLGGRRIIKKKRKRREDNDGHKTALIKENK